MFARFGEMEWSARDVLVLMERYRGTAHETAVTRDDEEYGMSYESLQIEVKILLDPSMEDPRLHLSLGSAEKGRGLSTTTRRKAGRAFMP